MVVSPTEQFRGIAVLKAPKLLRKHEVESIRDHGHRHIEVYLDQNRLRQGIDVEELHCPGYSVLHSPTAA